MTRWQLYSLRVDSVRLRSSPSETPSPAALSPALSPARTPPRGLGSLESVTVTSLPVAAGSGSQESLTWENRIFDLVSRLSPLGLAPA
jgi:hypothetical protein